jgi:chromosome segregation ATPase
VSDHYHYDYASTHHDHRGQHADDRHDHGLDYAEKHHRHYDDESVARGLREDLSRAEERIRELEDDLREALERIRALERQTPQAQQLQLEADLAGADLAESGYDRHGRDCQCPCCATDKPKREEAR